MMVKSSLDDILLWGPAATQHAVSWLHFDDDGFATAIAVKTGAKYWVVAKPLDDSVCPGNPDFGLKWDTSNIDKKYEMEAVVLRPGTVL